MNEALPLHQLRFFIAQILEPVIRFAGWLGVLIGRERFATEMRLRGALIGGGRNLRFGRNVEFSAPAARILLGRNVVFYGNTYVDANGDSGSVTIGSGTNIDHFCVLYGQGGLNIGRDCSIASGTIIYSQTNQDIFGDDTPVALQPVRFAPVFIGDGCWLGAGVRILPGVVLAKGCLVGAGAVVRQNIPESCVVAGVPARVIRQRTDKLDR